MWLCVEGPSKRPFRALEPRGRVFLYSHASSFILQSPDNSARPLVRGPGTVQLQKTPTTEARKCSNHGPVFQKDAVGLAINLRGWKITRQNIPWAFYPISRIVPRLSRDGTALALHVSTQPSVRTALHRIKKHRVGVAGSCILSAQMRVAFFCHTNESNYFHSSCDRAGENDCTYIIF